MQNNKISMYLKEAILFPKTLKPKKKSNYLVIYIEDTYVKSWFADFFSKA